MGASPARCAPDSYLNTLLLYLPPYFTNLLHKPMQFFFSSFVPSDVFFFFYGGIIYLKKPLLLTQISSFKSLVHPQKNLISKIYYADQQCTKYRHCCIQCHYIPSALLLLSTVLLSPLSLRSCTAMCAVIQRFRIWNFVNQAPPPL